MARDTLGLNVLAMLRLMLLLVRTVFFVVALVGAEMFRTRVSGRTDTSTKHILPAMDLDLAGAGEAFVFGLGLATGSFGRSARLEMMMDVGLLMPLALTDTRTCTEATTLQCRGKCLLVSSKTSAQEDLFLRKAKPASLLSSRSVLHCFCCARYTWYGAQGKGAHTDTINMP